MWLPISTVQHPNRSPDKGCSCFLYILLPESTHLVWMLGCERVIQGTTPTPDSIPKRWMSKINYRLFIRMQAQDQAHRPNQEKTNEPTQSGAPRSHDMYPCPPLLVSSVSSETAGTALALRKSFVEYIRPCPSTLSPPHRQGGASKTPGGNVGGPPWGLSYIGYHV